MAIWRRFTCWIIKDTLTQTHAQTRAATPTSPPTTHTHTHTEICSLILIAFPQQQ
jgi:hypothetical protein